MSTSSALPSTAEAYHLLGSLSQTAEFLGCSTSTVRRRLLELGVKLRPRGRPRLRLGGE